MKRLGLMLLCLVLIMGCLSACDQKKTETPKQTVLMVGYGRTVVTPEEPMPLRGYGNPLQRISTEVLDDLYATCVAFTDGEDNTVLLFHLDLCTSYNGPTMQARQAISEATGVPYDNIMVSATHMHSGPELTVEIHEDGLAGAKIGISSEVDGVFAGGTFTAADAACFTSDVNGIKVKNTDKGLALE